MCSCRRASAPVRVHIYTYICVSVRCGLLSLFLFSTPLAPPPKRGEGRESSGAPRMPRAADLLVKHTLEKQARKNKRVACLCVFIASVELL